MQSSHCQTITSVTGALRSKGCRPWAWPFRAVLWGYAVSFFALPANADDRRVVSVDRLDSTAGLVVDDGEVQIVPEGPRKVKVARFDAPFALRMDLAPQNINPRDFDLIKLEVNTDDHAFLVVSLENYPRPGDLSHWYVLDTARLAIPWQTIWIDLNRPEEVKPAGSYKGLAESDPNSRNLRIKGHVADIRRKLQPPGRSIRLGEVRFVKKTIDLDWDQSQAPYSWEPGQDLVFRYPLAITNRTDQPVTAMIRATPVETKHATIKLSEDSVSLKPREQRLIEARITLPAAVASTAAPLYCERFNVAASVTSQPDSDVTILRSSDPIPLSVTVPIAEEKLQFPLLPRVSTIPEKVTGFNARTRAQAVKIAAEVSPDDLAVALGPKLQPFEPRYGFVFNAKKDESGAAGSRFREGLTACAFLYDTTGEKTYLEKGTQLLLAAARLFPERLEEWRNTPYAPISQGIFAWNLLRTGWAVGSMRWPYHYQRHGMFNDFDLLARDMDPAARRTITHDLMLPCAIQMRNHYFGLTNQQDVVNYPVLYVGLVTRNWPLVSHAYDSPHGLLNQIKYNFDDDGLAGESNYHKPTVEPILYACELLHARGIDHYDDRLHTILHSPAAAAIRKPYNSPMLGFADSQRFNSNKIAAASSSDGQHLTTGTTLLRWKGREVGMNWGISQNRNAPDRCSLRINELGGGNYTHSSLGQSILIVDEDLQDPVPAVVLGYDIDGPVQFVSAASDRHYPGSSITRTFALLGDGVLVLDRVVSDRPRTVDWCLKGAGDKVALDMQEVPGGFTRKPDDSARSAIFGANLKFERHFGATTDGPWSEGNGRLMMAGQAGTRVFRFRVPASFSAAKAVQRDGVPVLMVRRTETRQTDYVAWFSGKTKSVERVPVMKSAGGEADALGAQITLQDGKVIRALVNFQPKTEVRLGDLVTDELFATDYVE